MHIVINSTAQQKEYIEPIFSNLAITVSFISDGLNWPIADAYIDFSYEEKGYAFSKITDSPVLVNSVIETAGHLPGNCIRFNGWPGFLQKGCIEIAAANELALKNAINIIQQMGLNYIEAPDEPGMFSARVLAMIINEAYFGLGENISSKKEIDTAMKLGTNYPFGPFEWSEMIGLHKVVQLLTVLSKSNERYAIAPAMMIELNKNKN
ncbi:MAG: 3-hydroxyacyl-CoA dehydrogenase family protein [Sediminibacterium sp.]|nr:MAG: 3-hydroxyacyl-CoA [Chitinophagaceae bacterium]MDP1842374.1 3-hydroxyacyl-CoA dehydrogenase family protein [Sediminibacterium sp.]TXT34243.1 MAG: 3-hydroxyacyl-CoA dehydrogenase [Chitinophagaceae bacterium]